MKSEDKKKSKNSDNIHSNIDKHRDYPDFSNGDDEISVEEQNEILRQIDKEIAALQLSDSSSQYDFNPLKKGYFFPIIVNILALFAIAVVVFLSMVFFGVRHENMILEASTYFSAEGKIIEQFKKATEEKLRKKDVQIFRIQKQLEKLDRERTVLISNMETAIQN